MSDAWDIYSTKMSLIGRSKRDMWVNHTQQSLLRRALDSPSCHPVEIDGEKQLAVIVHQANMSYKKIIAMPGEHLKHGGIVDFADNKWLITELDADNEVYERGIMRQCNHILRWIGKDGTLREKWCVVEDGTKYLIGEKAEDIMSIGDGRMAVTIGKDDETVELCRGLRFLIDDTDSEFVTAYQITKSNKLFNSYNGHGVFRFILNEVQLQQGDNKELRIADYTIWKPGETLDSDHVDSTATVAEIVAAAEAEAAIPKDDNKKGWL